MNPRNQIRRFELALVIGASVSIVLSGLIRDSINFDKIIRTLLLRGENVTDLQYYNRALHHDLPVIIFAVLTLFAWYVFHFHLVPQNEKNKFRLSNLGTALGSMALVTAGQLALLSTVGIDTTRTFGSGSALEMIYTYRYRINAFGYTAFPDIVAETKINSLDEIAFDFIGGISYPLVISNSLVVFALFFVYELISQKYYNLYRRFATAGHKAAINILSIALFLALVVVVIFKQTEIARYLIFPPFYFGVMIILFILVVYACQEFVYRALPISSVRRSKKKIPLYIGFYFVIVFLGASFLKATSYGFLYEADDIETLSDFFDFLWVPCITITFLSLPIGYARRSARKRRLLLEAELQLKKAELAHLQAQIQPHFLFNTLSALYTLALVDDSYKVAEGIQKLGDLMRFVLHDNNNERIPINDEIAYLRNYIDLQLLRLDRSRIEIEINISDVPTEFTIAPMLLNTFVENSFKHGISYQNPSWIFVTLNMDQKRLFFEVRNSVHKHKPASTDKGGIGLENVTKRLEMIYPDRHVLGVNKSEREYTVTLNIDFSADNPISA